MSELADFDRIILPSRPAGGFGDMLLRLPVAGWFGYAGLRAAYDCGGTIAALDLEILSLPVLADVIARLSLAIFLLAAAACALLRHRRGSGTAGPYSAGVAIGGTFLVMLLVGFPRAPLSPLMSLLATEFIICGNLLGALVLLRLGRSFSILPEARRLVSDGPYRFVRHPLYLAEELAVIGVFLQFAGWGSAVILVLHGLLQWERMRVEERVLRAAFPDYAAYAARTARLIPGLY